MTGDKAKELDEELKKSLDKLKQENDVKKLEYEKKIKDLQSQLFEYASYIGKLKIY